MIESSHSCKLPRECKVLLDSADGQRSLVGLAARAIDAGPLPSVGRILDQYNKYGILTVYYRPHSGLYNPTCTSGANPTSRSHGVTDVRQKNLESNVGCNHLISDGRHQNPSLCSGRGGLAVFVGSVNPICVAEGDALIPLPASKEMRKCRRRAERRQLKKGHVTITKVSRDFLTAISVNNRLPIYRTRRVRAPYVGC